MREDTVQPLRSGSTPGMFSFSSLNETEVTFMTPRDAAYRYRKARQNTIANKRKKINITFENLIKFFYPNNI